MLSSAFALLAVVASAVAQSCPATPNTSGFNNARLPSPFTFANGSPVTTRAQWTCRAAEISSLLQLDELGTMPGNPASLSASFSGTTLTITVNDQGRTISFAPTIRFPTSGAAPFPAIIAYGFPSIPIPSNVAVITFNNDDIAAQNGGGSRGQGKFYQLYGSGHSAGATLAWAWGVRRIMDALERTPAARIDPTRVGVTGCSRNGKGAFIAGAFEPRIALTIPQESGSGGTDCWRISDSILANGTSTQTASEIVGENVWYSTNFNQFSRATNRLPFDHHLLGAMIAPRGLFVIDQTGIDWLGPLSSWGCMRAAQTVWAALGASDSIGVSQAPGHTHCSFPASQTAQLNAFINRFLLRQSANTNIFTTAANYNFPVPGEWANWQTPRLT